MNVVEGLFVGAGVREPQEQTSFRNGEKYMTAERYVVAVSETAGELPQFYNCTSSAVMLSIKAAGKVGQAISLSGKLDGDRRLIVTGLRQVAARAG
jgi:hypothetical protein